MADSDASISPGRVQFPEIQVGKAEGKKTARHFRLPGPLQWP